MTCQTIGYVIMRHKINYFSSNNKIKTQKKLMAQTIWIRRIFGVILQVNVTLRTFRISMSK